MNTLQLMKERHSVRQYTNKPIEPKKRAILENMIKQINQEQGLHIQIFYDEPKCFDSIMAHYGKFSGVKNYIALVGKKSADLDEKLGYFGEMLVLKAQEIGLNTCWVALTHGKSQTEIADGEKLGCLISLGYGVSEGATHKNKPPEKVCNYTPDMPKWFIDGVEAALLAPTALNQQKFYLELKPDGTVKATCSKGFYTKMDLGIVKYHFEAITNKKIAD